MPKITIGSAGLKNPVGGIGDTLSSAQYKKDGKHAREERQLHPGYMEVSWLSLAEKSAK